MSHPMETVIEPQRGFQVLGLRSLWAHRDLIRFMVWRDVKVRYAQTIMGLGWAILRPLITMLLFSLIFGKAAQMPSDGVPYPLFSYAGLVPWTYFATSVGASASSLVGNPLLTKVYFPRLIIPLNPIFSNLVDFTIALMIMGVLLVRYKTMPPIEILMLPLFVVLMMMAATGLGLWLAALAVQSRDVKFAATFLIQLLMYAAPVIWPLSLVPENLRLVYGLYPMAGVIEGFRAALIGSVPMPWDVIGVGAVSSVLMLASGMLYFRYRERVFADVL